MQTKTHKITGTIPTLVKSARQVAADAIAKRRTRQMADDLEAAQNDRQPAIPGPLLWQWYANQPGARILPGGVIELPN